MTKQTSILLIDDDPLVLSTLSTVLKRANHAVIVAGDGAEGMAKLKRQPIDVVITDLLMPNKDGLETIMELGKTSPTTKVIAMSGGGKLQYADYLSVAKHLGAFRTLQKPFTPTVILEAVEEALLIPAEAPALPV